MVFPIETCKQFEYKLNRIDGIRVFWTQYGVGGWWVTQSKPVNDWSKCSSIWWRDRHKRRCKININPDRTWNVSNGRQPTQKCKQESTSCVSPSPIYMTRWRQVTYTYNHLLRQIQTSSSSLFYMFSFAHPIFKRKKSNKFAFLNKHGTPTDSGWFSNLSTGVGHKADVA